MATARPLAIVDALTSAVDYLRITVGDGPGDWVGCAELVHEPDRLGDVVAGTRPARGTDRDDVAMSLFVQGYAFRIAALAVGSWVLADALVDVDPATTAVGIGRGRPNAVRLDEPVRVVAPADVVLLHEVLVEQHLAPLVTTARSACRIGAALLWGNVAASCSAAFGAFAGAPSLAHRRGDVADRAQSFFAAARPELRDAGRLVRVGDRVAWERRSCCLWYRTAGGSLCEDCSLRPAGEHAARYAAMAEVGA